MLSGVEGLDGADVVGDGPRDAGYPHAEVHDGVVHWVVLERNKEVERRTTGDLDEFLYWAALHTTRDAAARWELDHRGLLPGCSDTRVGWLARQVQLLGMVRSEWADRFRAQIPQQCPGVRLEDVDAYPDRGRVRLWRRGKGKGRSAGGAEVWDRFGSPLGRFAHPKGTPFAQRSLPPTYVACGYHVYSWIRPWSGEDAEKYGFIQSGKVAPWFGQPGGGTQFLLPEGISVQWLIDQGYLREESVR
ncbi:hemagglutinin/hemolysin-related protein [Streptomyces sp. 769]|nr:hemagglutinin/hemolysin-related protein [Streptomyces sp. 769]